MTTDKKRGGLTVNSQFHIGPTDAQGELAELIRCAKGGANEFMRNAAESISDGNLSWHDVDLRAMFLATIDQQIEVRADLGPALGQRTITTSAFPVLSGLLTAQLLDNPPEDVETIWQDLVTVRPTIKDTEHLVRIANSDSHTGTVGGRLRDSYELDGYPLLSTGEDRVQVDTVHDGRRLAISAKVIETNDKPALIQQIDWLREWANDRREQVTLQRVFDLYGSAAAAAAPYVYRPNGSGSALYTTTTTTHVRAPSGTRINNNALVDGTKIQAAIDVLANMRNGNGKRMSVGTQFDLIVPHALLAAAMQITGSEMTPGTVNELSPYGPRGRYAFNILSSSKIDDFTTTDWLLAKSARRQFVLVSRIDMEYVSMPASMQDFLRTRLGFEARIADEFEVGAADHNRVVQSLSDSTAPSAPALGA